mmetsp:Transcript_25763/g.68826  ORF Transcript_25763/g.68826 Transcript_25763/m.68826 type:complete len:161 (+) Transcript_25763:620-1102(+)
MWLERCTLNRRCAITITVRGLPRRGDQRAFSSACATRRADVVSRAEYASSRMSTGGSRTSARAMARRWRCPPESSLESATTVSYPWGRPCTKSSRQALRAAERTSASVGGGSRPQPMFSAMVARNSRGSWLTMPNWRRSHEGSRLRMSAPSNRMLPCWVS